VGVIAALRSRFAASLASRLLDRGLGASQGFAGSGTGFALGPEELLLAQAELALQTVDLFLEEFLTSEGSMVHALPVSGLTPGLELGGQARTNRARTSGNSSGGANGQRGNTG
jgi:hypothetical protein